MMGHEKLGDIPEELEMLKKMLERRIGELRERTATLEAELRLVEEKLARLAKEEVR